MGERHRPPLRQHRHELAFGQRRLHQFGWQVDDAGAGQRRDQLRLAIVDLRPAINLGNHGDAARADERPAVAGAHVEA